VNNFYLIIPVLGLIGLFSDGSQVSNYKYDSPMETGEEQENIIINHAFLPTCELFSQCQIVDLA
jgi:hypothetical protein